VPLSEGARPALGFTTGLFKLSRFYSLPVLYTLKENKKIITIDGLPSLPPLKDRFSRGIEDSGKIIYKSY